MLFDTLQFFIIAVSLWIFACTCDGASFPNSTHCVFPVIIWEFIRSYHSYVVVVPEGIGTVVLSKVSPLEVLTCGFLESNALVGLFIYITLVFHGDFQT